MKRRETYSYGVRVYDPTQDNEVFYPDIRTFTDASAIQLAKDGYTGLLGNRPQDHLEVEIVHKFRFREGA